VLIGSSISKAAAAGLSLACCDGDGARRPMGEPGLRCGRLLGGGVLLIRCGLTLYLTSCPIAALSMAGAFGIVSSPSTGVRIRYARVATPLAPAQTNRRGTSLKGRHMHYPGPWVITHTAALNPAPNYFKQGIQEYTKTWVKT
jgi:hypothetical protein